MTPLRARRLLGLIVTVDALVAALMPHVTKWQGVAVSALIGTVMICDRHGWLWYDRASDQRHAAADRDRERQAFGGKP